MKTEGTEMESNMEIHDDKFGELPLSPTLTKDNKVC